MVPLCSVLVLSHFEFWGQVWAPQFEKDRRLLESIRRRTVNMVKGLEGKPCKGVLELSWLFQPGKEEAEGRAYHELQLLLEYTGGTALISAVCDQ